MAEDDSESNGNEELLAGLNSGDIKPAVYEGGFKTWECAIDLAKLLIHEKASFLSETRTDIQVIEVRVHLRERLRELRS
jgi:protein-histidine N-methyltransferase